MNLVDVNVYNKEYFIRDDLRNNKENYYIKDNDSNTIMPTLIIGA